MKRFRAMTPIGFGVVLLATFIFIGPANAVLSGTVDSVDNGCTGYVIRDTKYALTGKTTYAPCHVHRVRAKIQPPTSGGASWSNWIGSNTVAKITTSYTVVDSNHQVFN